MASQSYYEMLRDPRWQRKRLEIMERADFRCESCGSGKQTLNVHHSLYQKELRLWEYADYTLFCLCEDCHMKAEWARDNLNVAIGCLKLEDVEKVLHFALGLGLVNGSPEPCPLTTIYFGEEKADVLGLSVISGIMAANDEEWDKFLLWELIADQDNLADMMAEYRRLTRVYHRG